MMNWIVPPAGSSAFKVPCSVVSSATVQVPAVEIGGELAGPVAGVSCDALPFEAEAPPGSPEEPPHALKMKLVSAASTDAGTNRRRFTRDTTMHPSSKVITIN